MLTTSRHAGPEPSSRAHCLMQSSKLPCEVCAPAFSTLIRKRGHRALASQGHPTRVAPPSPPEYLPDSQVKGRVPSPPAGTPKNTGVGSLCPTQESNQDLLHCRQIFYQLSYQGSPLISIRYFCLLMISSLSSHPPEVQTGISNCLPCILTHKLYRH